MYVQDKLIDALQQKLQAKENELSELRRQLQEVRNSIQRERERDVGHKSSIEPATNLADKLPLPLPPSDLSHPFRNSPILPSLMPAKLPANFALSTPPHLTRDFSPEKSNPHPPPSQQALAPPAPSGAGEGGHALRGRGDNYSIPMNFENSARPPLDQGGALPPSHRPATSGRPPSL